MSSVAPAPVLQASGLPQRLPQRNPIRPKTVPLEDVPRLTTLTPAQQQLLVVDPNRPIMTAKQFYDKVAKEMTERHPCLNPDDNPMILLHAAVEENVEEEVRRDLLERMAFEQSNLKRAEDEYDRRYQEAGYTPQNIHFPTEAYLNIEGAYAPLHTEPHAKEPATNKRKKE
jgi:hypothetical protein